MPSCEECYDYEVGGARCCNKTGCLFNSINDCGYFRSRKMMLEMINEGLEEDTSDLETTGIKFDQDKPRTDLLPTMALMEVASVLGFGAKKYGDHNWRGGIAQLRLAGAALRHVFKWIAGKDTDEESGLNHIAHGACCLLMLLEMIALRQDLDNRHKPTEGKR